MTLIVSVFIFGGASIAITKFLLDFSLNIPFESGITVERVLFLIFYFMIVFMIYNFIDSKYEIRRKLQ